MCLGAGVRLFGQSIEREREGEREKEREKG